MDFSRQKSTGATDTFLAAITFLSLHCVDGLEQ